MEHVVAAVILGTSTWKMLLWHVSWAHQLGKCCCGVDSGHIRFERQPPARIIQLLVGMSQPNMRTRDFALVSDNHEATIYHLNALGDIL